jgi:hypothetical protein
MREWFSSKHLIEHVLEFIEFLAYLPQVVGRFSRVDAFSRLVHEMSHCEPVALAGF